jgi:hypothetical protein
VTLLVELLPLVARESCFALKGGTAINLFVRDLPRLSVDIDLTYLPMLSPRFASLAQVFATQPPTRHDLSPCKISRIKPSAKDGCSA